MIGNVNHALLCVALLEIVILIMVMRRSVGGCSSSWVERKNALHLIVRMRVGRKMTNVIVIAASIVVVFVVVTVEVIVVVDSTTVVVVVVLS